MLFSRFTSLIPQLGQVGVRYRIYFGKDGDTLVILLGGGTKQRQQEGIKDFRWRKDSPIRPVVFDAPPGIDEDVVQLHLSHRVAQRLLGRFLAQGLVHHDLSRACLVQSADAIPRVVLLGRLSLYGQGAIRLHEEVLTVSARWSDAAARRSRRSPCGREAETRTLDPLEPSLKPGASRQVPEQVVTRGDILSPFCYNAFRH